MFERIRIDRPSGHTSVEAIATDLTELAAELRSRRPADEPLVGVGVAVVGVVRRSDGFVSNAPNLGWRDVPLGAALADSLDVPVPISVANDADLGALVELRRGAAIGYQHMLFISGEYGVGGGVIVDGQPLTGASGYGGEVGHLPVNPSGSPCRCGSVGCWETEIGEAALLRMAGRPTGGGRGEVDADAERGRERLAGGPERARPCGPLARHRVGRPGQHLQPGVDRARRPVRQIHPFVGPGLEHELDRRALPAPRGLVRVVPAMLGVDAPLLGAAELAFEPLIADPAGWLAPRRSPLELASA